jgi:sigma-B regulation protein RsbU (phosphoserine phosphatase)
MNNELPASLELRITSTATDALAGASRQLRDYLGRHGVGARALYAVDLALEELGANILRHAFPAGATATFVLRAIVKPDRVELVFEDNGIAFDPTAVPAPKRSRSIQETAIGGLGIAMVRNAVQRMTYSRPDARNRLEVLVARD